jgi:O-antigen/teichoic acid export membrane protein
VLRGGSWNLVGLFVPQLALLVLSVAAARFLGPDQFGRQSFIAFVEVSVVMLLAGGLPLALTRYAGDALGRGRSGVVVGLARWVGWMAIAGAAIGAAIMVGFGVAGATPRAAWFLAAVVVAASLIQRVPSAVLNGLQRWRAASVVGVVMAVVAAGATVAVLWAGGGIVGMFAVEAAVTLASLVWLWSLSRRAEATLGEPRAVDPELRRDFLRYAFIATLGVILTFVVWRRSEFLFLNHYSTDSEIAVYSVAFSAVAALLLIPQAIVGVLLPAVATLLGAGATERIRQGFERAIRLLLVLTLPMTALAIALGPLALRLVYGEDFSGAGPVVVLLLLPLPIVTLMNLSKVVLAGMGRQRFQLASGAVGAVANIGLDFALIPHYDAVGAALANAGGQLVSGLPVLVYAIRRIGVRHWEPWPLARTLLASIAAGLGGWLVQHWLGGVAGLLVGLTVATALFAALAVALRILTVSDAVWLDDMLGRLFGGRLGRVIRVCARPQSQAGVG